jgi:hypothetical protein
VINLENCVLNEHKITLGTLPSLLDAAKRIDPFQNIGQIALNQAVYYGYFNLVKSLIKSGIPIPLSLAAFRGHTTIVKHLKSYPAPFTKLSPEIGDNLSLSRN